MKQNSLFRLISPEHTEENPPRVLTLWQPYASLYAAGLKKNETRPSATSHTSSKGLYLIHAAKTKNKHLRELAETKFFKEALDKLGLKFDELPFGKIIGSVEISYCSLIVNDCGIGYGLMTDKTKYTEEEIAFGDFSNGRYVWKSENHIQIKNPFDYKGGQGYYRKYKGNFNLIKELI